MRSVRKLSTAMLSACVGFALTGSALAVDFPETEDNNNKAAANAVTLNCGDTISGSTTGTSTTVAGPASADYFLITTPTAAPGIYKYTLTITSAVPGHTGTIRGLNQTGGVPGTTDSSMQTSLTAGTDRINVFYGFGNGGRIYYRVTGTATTTAPYTVTLTCTPVSPINFGSFLNAGPITIKPDAATEAAIDTDFWVYDGSYNAILDAGHDDADATGITRTLSNGDYYIALGNYNSCNNLGSPLDDTFRTGLVLDFPGIWACASTTASLPNMNMTVSDGVTTLPAFGSRSSAFEVAWSKFRVGATDTPSAIGAQSPNPVIRLGAVTLTLTVTPAPGSSLDNITSITGNIAAVSGNAGDTAVAFTRTGPGSSDWSLAIASAAGVVGNQLVNYTIVDPMSPGGNGVGAFGVVIAAPPAANDLCANATVISTLPFNDSVVADTATNDIDVSCNAAANTESRYGVWYSYRTGADGGTLALGETGTNDTNIAVFTGSCNSLTQIFCSDPEVALNVLLPQPNTDYYILVSMSSATAIPTGNYTLAVTGFTAATGGCCTAGSCTLLTASACTGTYLGAGTTCSAGPQYQNTNLGLAIPDYAGTVIPVTSTITVPATDTTMITDLAVVVGINHTFGGDVKLTLTGPNNMTVDLFVRPGTAGCVPGEIGNGNDLVGTYTLSAAGAANINAALIAGPSPLASGVYRPSRCNSVDANLNGAFAGIPLAGTWTLTASDEDEALVGTLESFGLQVNGGYSPCPGSCCIATSCTAVSQAACLSGGGTFTAGGSCSPDPCGGGGQLGACCRGATCTSALAADCTGFASAFSGAGTVCNAFPGNYRTPCCFGDYNHVGGIGVQDIFDFLAGYFSSDPKADVNGGGIGVQDIFDYLFVYFAAGC